MNSCYSVNSVSFLIAEGVDPFLALSADLQVLEWEFESAKETETCCFLKGLRLAVTSGFTLEITLETSGSLMPSRLRRLCVVVVVEIYIVFVEVILLPFS